MRILLFLGFIVLSVLIPVGLAQAQPPHAAGSPVFVVPGASAWADVAWAIEK